MVVGFCAKKKRTAIKEKLSLLIYIFKRKWWLRPGDRRGGIYINFNMSNGSNPTCFVTF
jgi:hypothetical protein